MEQDDDEVELVFIEYELVSNWANELVFVVVTFVELFVNGNLTKFDDDDSSMATLTRPFERHTSLNSFELLFDPKHSFRMFAFDNEYSFKHTSWQLN